MVLNKFVITNKPVNRFNQFGSLFFLGEPLIIDDDLFFFDITTVEKQMLREEYFTKYLSSKEDFLKQINGSFSLFHFNKKTNLLTVATDRLGKELIYSYVNEYIFLFSTDFWEGVSVLDFGVDDIDIIKAKEYIVLNRPMLSTTIIRNYDIVYPGNYYEINVNNLNLTKKKYWEMKFNRNPWLSFEEASHKLDLIFSDYFKKVKSNLGQKIFGIGLSGGLDSRILLAYAMQNNLKVKTYCVGQKRKYLFATMGYRIVKKLSKIFKLSTMFIDAQSVSYKNKLYQEILYQPAISSNVDINVLDKVPAFDYMLNGEHGGVFFGEFDFLKVLNYSKDDLYQHLIRFLSFFSKQKKYEILSEEELSQTAIKLREYIDTENNRFDAFYRFFFEVYGSKTRNGFFESNYGTKKATSPFLDNAFIDFYLTWPHEFIIKRSFQKYFYKKYFTELTKIEDESFDAPLYWRKDSPKYGLIRYLFALRKRLLGTALNRKIWIRKNKQVEKLCKELLSDDIFMKKYLKNYEWVGILKENPRTIFNILKVKLIYDVLGNKKKLEMIKSESGL